MLCSRLAYGFTHQDSEYLPWKDADLREGLGGQAMGMEERDWYREDYRRRQTIKAGKASVWHQSITITRKQLVIHFMAAQVGVLIGLYILPRAFEFLRG